MKKTELIKSLKVHGFNSKIISAMESIPREKFVPESVKGYTYDDVALPIGFGQTISQPSTIAFMLHLLELKDEMKILEIGSGSGYVIALINKISKNSIIYGIEKINNLAEKARTVLKQKNIIIITASGSKGYKQEAPFDRIIVSAASDKIIEALKEQLSDDGILVMPIKSTIVKIMKKNNNYDIKEYPGFSFVPLV